MARQAHTAQQAPGSYPASGTALTFTAADTTDKEEFTMTGQELLIARNEDASPHNVTIESAANQRGRTGDISSDAIAAGAWHVYGPFTNRMGWEQGGKLLFEADDANIEFAVVKIA